VLVEAGADLLAKDALGLTPLDLADKMEHTEVMEILRGAVDRQEGSHHSSQNEVQLVQAVHLWLINSELWNGSVSVSGRIGIILGFRIPVP